MDNPFLLYDNRFADASPTATGTASGYSALSIADMRSYTFWKAAAAGTNYLTVDCASAKQANCLAIVGHNLGTAAALVSLEVSSDAAIWNSPLVPFAAVDDSPLVRPFVTAPYRYFRLKIVTATVAPQIAILIVGSRLDFPFYFTAPLTPYEEKVVADVSDSKAGHLLGVVTRYFPFEGIYRAEKISGDWYREDYRDFWTNHGRLFRPFVFVPCLDALPADILWCRMQSGATYKPVYQYSPRKVDVFDFKVQGANLGA